MANQMVDYDSEEIRKLGAVVAALVAVREEEIVSCIREMIDAAFADSPGRLVLEILRGSVEPLSLKAIAARCGCGRRSVLPEGRVRIVVERLGRAGIVANRGTPEKPRYSLDAGDKRVQILEKIYGPIRFVSRSGTL
jgi:hypothetical protein